MPTSPRPPTGPQPGLRERKKARTKATIQREALRLFDRDGYAETSVEQIAAAAEISPSTFFRYFATKEDVVLADFIDARAVERLLEAPADLGPLQALRHALASTMREMGEEELALERLRNELIQSVPELRRGMISELVRPMRLLAEALAQRLGRPADDPDLQMFAGAAVGGMIITASDDPEPSFGPGEPTELLSQVLTRLDRLDRMLRLP
jgi:AcrR family transcriptional regulator